MPKRGARRRREGQPELPQRPKWHDAQGAHDTHDTHDTHDDRADGRRSHIPPPPAKGAFTPHARRAPRH